MTMFSLESSTLFQNSHWHERKGELCQANETLFPPHLCDNEKVSVRPLLWWASFHLTSVTECVCDAIAPMGWFSSQTIQMVQGPCAKQINCAAISLGLESHEQQLRMRFNPVAFERLLYCIHLSSFSFSIVLYPKLMVTFLFHLYLSLIAFLASLKKKYEFHFFTT